MSRGFEVYKVERKKAEETRYIDSEGVIGAWDVCVASIKFEVLMSEQVLWHLEVEIKLIHQPFLIDGRMWRREQMCYSK
jgi:hypothetical protein